MTPALPILSRCRMAVYVRMALIMTLLGLPDPKTPDAKEEH